jgi:imidazole glycerol-phosphate synthase subunit HisH
MIGVLDYGMGNLSSVINALEYLGLENCIIHDSEEFKTISHLIIPGVGSFAKAMENLKERGYVEAITSFNNQGFPILGICLGMQLLAEKGTEPYESDGLGLIKGSVEIFPENSVRVPHVGWNGIKLVNNHPILEDVKQTADFYFVHSYQFQVENENNIISTTNYGFEFPSIVMNEKQNVVGIQFHPEKSQKQGLQILTNFSNTNA